MIDKSNVIYTKVKNAVSSLCENTGQSIDDVPSSFPYLDFNQVDNPVYKRAADFEEIENAISPMVEIDIYTTGTSKLTNGKKIAKLADEEMLKLGFVRKFGPQKIDNLQDKSICRLKTRYQRVFCEGDNI